MNFRSMLIALCVCCALGGCASRSISFDSVRPVPPYDSSRRAVAHISSGVIGWTALPHRDLIRVDFSSDTDFRSLVAGAGNILFLHSYFCDGGDRSRSAGAPGVYVDLADAASEKPVHRFIFFIDVSRPAGPLSVPPEPGFDLSMKPEDVCFYVTAHGVIDTYQSLVGRVPKAAIEQVFVGWDVH
jgi:hypothetical protein